MKVLVIDVGGNNVKVSLSGRKGDPIKIPSGPDMTAARMAAAVKKAAQGSKYDAVSIGYPGPVVNGRPSEEPANLGQGWVGFDYRKAFGKPVRVVNDAAMQALGSYQGGRMLFLGPRHRPRVGPRDRRCAGSHGARAHALQDGADLRGLRGCPGHEAAGQEEVDASTSTRWWPCSSTGCSATTSCWAAGRRAS